MKKTTISLLIQAFGSSFKCSWHTPVVTSIGIDFILKNANDKSYFKGITSLTAKISPNQMYIANNFKQMIYIDNTKFLTAGVEVNSGANISFKDSITKLNAGNEAFSPFSQIAIELPEGVKKGLVQLQSKIKTVVLKLQVSYEENTPMTNLSHCQVQ